jgi:hypothetical protein
MAMRTRRVLSIKPSHLILAVAFAAAAVTMASGIAGALEASHDPHRVSREVFYGIPHAMRAVFYVVVTGRRTGSAANQTAAPPRRRTVPAGSATSGGASRCAPCCVTPRRGSCTP